MYDPITVARFWSKVDVRPSRKECWPWTGATRQGGYGGIKIGGIVVRANRIAWELLNGERLGDRQALHTCDNPTCCNPFHIYPGDNVDNMRDFYTARSRSHEKLSREVAEEIRERIQAGISLASLAAAYGVTRPTISKIKNMRRWR